MPIDVTCTCGKRFAVHERYAGKRGKCPECGAALLVPMANDADGDALFDLAQAEEQAGGAPRAIDLKEPAARGTRTCFGCNATMPEGAILCTNCGRSTLGHSATTEIGDENAPREPGWFTRPFLSFGNTEISPLKFLVVVIPLAALLIYYYTGPARPILIRSATAVRVIDALDHGATRDQYSLYTGTGDRSLGHESALATSSQGNISTDTDALTYSVGGSDALVVTRPDAVAGDAVLVRLGLRQSKVRAAGATSGYDSVLSGGDFTLVPEGGGDAIPARLLYADFLQPEAYVDLGGAQTTSTRAPLPPVPPTRFTQQKEKGSVRAVAVYEGDTQGTVRLAASRSYDGAPAPKGVTATGQLKTTHAVDRNFTVEHDYQGGTLTVRWGAADTGHWVKPSFKQHSAMSPWKRYELTLLFEPGTGKPATGRYELHYRGENLATVKVKAAPSSSAATASNSAAKKKGRTPGVSPIKRQQGVPSKRKINPNNPLAYFDILLESRDMARGIVSASNLRQLGFGLMFYADDHGGELPDSLDELESYIPGMAGVMTNPRTGDQPGFIYEKPPKGADPSQTIVIWESLNGQKDPDGAMLYADGSIR